MKDRVAMEREAARQRRRLRGRRIDERLVALCQRAWAGNNLGDAASTFQQMIAADEELRREIDIFLAEFNMPQGPKTPANAKPGRNQKFRKSKRRRKA
jgi:hypothetical protein